MKKLFKSIALSSLLVVLLSFSSCDDRNASFMPGITGKIGEIYVIIDKPLWDSEIGDTIRSVFTQPYPMLPQVEPMFKLMTIPYANFSKSFQRHRNLIIVNIKPEMTEAKLEIRNNMWAEPQIILNIAGPDIVSIIKLVNEKRDIMVNYIEQAELDRQTSNAIKYEDPALREAAERKFGVRIFIPQGYRLLPVTPDANFLWYTNRTVSVDQGIFIYSYPFTSDSTFTVKYLVEKRNEFLKQYVPGTRDSSWMITNPLAEVDLKIKSFKGQTYGELRSLWDVENDYMGGPFISRSYVDNANRRIVVIEGYVYAPRYDKRDYVRRLEGIINTFTLTIPSLDSNSGADSVNKK